MIKTDMQVLAQIKSKANYYFIFYKHGHDDFEVWATDDPSDELSGGSIRSTRNDIIEECKDDIPVEELEKILC